MNNNRHETASTDNNEDGASAPDALKWLIESSVVIGNIYKLDIFISAKSAPKKFPTSAQKCRAKKHTKNAVQKKSAQKIGNYKRDFPACNAPITHTDWKQLRYACDVTRYCWDTRRLIRAWSKK